MTTTVRTRTNIERAIEKVSDRLADLIQLGKIQRVTIDMVRACCAVAAEYEAMEPYERQELEEKAMRKLITGAR